jgi:hypothetical protein
LILLDRYRRASLTLKADQVLKQSISVVYEGDADDRPTTAILPTLTRQSFKGLARALVLFADEMHIRSAAPRPFILTGELNRPGCFG